MENIDKERERENQKFTQEIVEETQKDFERRRKERRALERQWELNLNFVAGNQYYAIDGRGELFEEEKSFFWQKREVFNHIAPIVETRLAKFAKVTPAISVRPRSDDDADAESASLAEKLVESAFIRSDFDATVRQTTAWSDICGTAFYKVIWNNDGGNKVGVYDGKEVFEGEAEIISVSPFEIFPDSLYTEKMKDQKSVIHAKAVSVVQIKDRYGVEIAGEDIDVFDLGEVRKKTGYGETRKTLSDSVTVIEKYERPTAAFPNGRLIIVAGDKLLYYGELPYINGDDGKRTFPFVKQESIATAGSFFGASVVERLIPVQRAYNAVKNRKHEFLNRLSTGILTVEDGSVDTDDLSEEGLPPGKILVYRQGAKTPEMMTETTLPPDFEKEEERLVNEFVMISGVSDVTSSFGETRVTSGTALEILVGQDNERLTMNAEIIRRCYISVAKLVLRLYAQFIKGVKAIAGADDFDKTRVYYADGKSAKSDDVYIAGENELLYTDSQKKELLLKLFESGLLSDEEGKVRQSVKEKVLSLMGYKELDYKNGTSRLQREKAVGENIIIRKSGLPTEEIDDDEIHIAEHTRYALSEYPELTEEEKQRIFAHIKEHKQKIANKDKEKNEDGRTE